MPEQCSECSRVFSVKSNLTRHLRMVHSIEIERLDTLARDFDVHHYKCLEGCNISFRYNRELRTHLRADHGMTLTEMNLDFPNSEEFFKWLHNEESINCVQYVHLTATKRKSTGVETFYYECSRTGKNRNQLDDTVRRRRARKWLTKLNRGCTSQIIVHKSHEGSYSVNYHKTHYGHKSEVEHLKLTKQDRATVASKLLLGVPISRVLHSVKNTNGNVKRINLLARKDIMNIGKSFNIDLKDRKLVNMDGTNVKLFLTECNSHSYNPVLYCNINDPEGDNICFTIMSEYQSEMLREFGDNIVLVNSISLKNCDFELITIFVIGSNWETFPAACMFTDNIDSHSYKLFFEKIRERVGNIVPSILFTNCGEMYYQAWKNVMGEVPHPLYTPLQVDIDWKLHLNLIVCSETEVTRIKRKWVYDTIRSLQTNRDEADFFENFDATIKVLQGDEDFKDFLEYFVQNYNDPKKWADCYKVGLRVSSKQLEIISDVLRQYLNEEVEVRFDKIFHSLVRFIRDETVNSMLHSKTQRLFFINENDNRHGLSMSKNFSGNHLAENLWNVLEEGTTHVVQKYLEKRCCNLICSTCHICLHTFSCSCVDFFVGNAICTHIHYIWVTYFQSIVQDDDDGNDDKELNCDEEIIIEIDENQREEVDDDAEILRGAIIERTRVLASNINGVESTSALKVILDTLDQLCDLSTVNQIVTDDAEKGCLVDHSYL